MVELATDQEEADTKVFLCVKHASHELGYTSVCIYTVDSDISVYAFYFQKFFQDTQIFIQTGTGIKQRVLDIQSISIELGVDCCDALPALHAFTGNDYTSAFHGIGKVRVYKTMMKSEEFISMFKRFGNSYVFDSRDFGRVEEFVCALYGLKKCKDVNEARYTKFCSNAKVTEPQKLPPTRAALLCHCKRVSYVTLVIKKSLENHPEVPSPHDVYGWTIEDGKLEIQWMASPPAPEQVLQLINCACKKGCNLVFI